MKYLLIFVTLIYAALTPAVTLDGRLAELTDLAGIVIGAEIVSDPAPTVISTVFEAEIRYVSISGDTATDNRVKLVGTEQATDSGNWYWLSKPSVIPQPETKLLTSRTTGGWGGLSLAAQTSAVQTFCNSVYTAANVGAQAIREFTVVPIKGDTVKVSGYFDIGTTWEWQSWYIRLIDSNGSVAAPYTNIQFERVAVG